MIGRFDIPSTWDFSSVGMRAFSHAFLRLDSRWWHSTFSTPVASSHFMPKSTRMNILCRVFSLFRLENVANRDEFDGDSDAGVYNPVVLPWRNRI